MLRIYLTNLGKYNEGELIGEWVTLPVTTKELEKVFERIGISEEPDENGIYYEEYFITDYETDFNYEIGEYDSLDDLNELAETLESLNSYEMDIVKALLAEFDLEEALEKKDDCIVYSDCNDMADVAEQYAEETGLLDSIPENLRYYFDFEAFGRDMGIEGHFIFTDDGNCVQIL